MQGLADFQTCSLVSTGFAATNVAYGFALAQGSPYRKLFNYHLNAMMEDGEMQRIKGRYVKVHFQTPIVVIFNFQFNHEVFQIKLVVAMCLEFELKTD